MTTLAFEGGAPRHLLTRLLDTPNLAQVVQSLDPKVLHQLVRHFGLEECGEVIALATTQQLTQIFDDDLWSSDTPGAEDQFDADRFGLWLEVLAEVGDSVAAQKLVAMDFDFVAGAISRQVLVLDREALRMCELPDEIDFGDYDPLREELKERALEESESYEVGGYTVIAKRSESWDALLSLLRSLDHEHRAFFGKLMKRCCQISTEWIVDNGGLHEVLTSDEQVMADIAGAREERRQQQGHVSPSQAAVFLKLARKRDEDDTPLDLDPITAAYFRDLKRGAQPGEHLHAGVVERRVNGFLASLPLVGISASGLNDPRRLLLPAQPSSGGDRLSRIRAQLLFAQDHQSAAYVRRTEELAYLANVLVAGCSFQSRRFRAVEAADAVLAVCNLGLENWVHPTLPPDFLLRQDLVTVFRTGWRILYEDVCLFAAKHLVEALSELRCDDRDIQNQITDLFRRMKTQAAAGTPWRERDNLNVIAILDPPSWAMLVNLVDECAVVPRNACTPSEKPPLRVTTEFEFVSENCQIAWARDFAESLPALLTR
jgi:hypothetical protein